MVDGPLLPNYCHAQSPFLFWTIIAIGSQRYVKDPTIIVQLGPKVVELAKQAILSRENILTNIQAFLLLCFWPMPHDTLSKDITPMIAGATLQLAMAIGLHIYGVGQDFSRTKLQFDRWHRDYRMRLWALCRIAVQR